VLHRSNQPSYSYDFHVAHVYTISLDSLSNKRECRCQWKSVSLFTFRCEQRAHRPGKRERRTVRIRRRIALVEGSDRRVGRVKAPTRPEERARLSAVSAPSPRSYAPRTPPRVSSSWATQPYNFIYLPNAPVYGLQRGTPGNATGGTIAAASPASILPPHGPHRLPGCRRLAAVAAHRVLRRRAAALPVRPPPLRPAPDRFDARVRGQQ
jgi:hypothetical protein